MADAIVRKPRREAGVAMFITVLILVIMGWLGLSALDNATRDQQVAGYQNRSRSAFFAADAGAMAARKIVELQEDKSATPNLPTAFLGDAAMYARWQQQPSYQADPASLPTPIKFIGEGHLDGFNQANGKFVNGLWRVRVMGQSYDAAGGVGSHRASTDRLEVTIGKPMASTTKSGY